ncbi:MAG: hypothetical protein KVP17_004824 [Porospora cf. gigantea B]|uniref:uncharacterized protein n=1 Tax=Porospora cf. gigantea B TaxID=2853592 RepID=UPI0035718259|nr:MAG: hypothetical protein KVP17_004824 [Porospora cf. gigantea B]
MRRIGEGQVLRIATTPEVANLVETIWREAKNLRANETLFNLESPAHPDDVLSLTLGDMQESKAVPDSDLRAVLQALCGWLILAEIQTDAMQHNLLCVQSVRNIWRKHAYRQLVRRHIEFEVDEVPAALREALDVFRDEVDFAVPTYSVRSHSGHDNLKHEVLSRHKFILKERSCLPVDERTDKEIAEFLLKELHEVHVRSTRDTDAYDAYEAQMEAEEEEEEEEEKEQEQQKEQRQEQEQEHVTEEETPQSQKWSRGPANPHPWTLHDLSRGPWETEAFFPLKEFGVFRKLGKRAKGLGFPEELWVSQNYYDLSWSTTTHRRLKNCSVVMEWIPDSSRESQISLDYHRRFTNVIAAYKRPDGTIPVSKLTSVLLDLDIVEHHADDPSITQAEAQTISRVLLDRISHLRNLPAAEVAALLPRGCTPRTTPPPANQKAIDALFAAPSIPVNTLRSRGRAIHAVAATADAPLLKSQAATIDLLGLAHAPPPRKINSDLLELDSQPTTPVTARSFDAEFTTDTVTENELTVVLMVEGWQGLLEGPTGGSPLFGRTDNRYYLILSLEEAEGIRASAHVAQKLNIRTPIYPGVRVALRHVNARFSLIDPLYAPKCEVWWSV